MFVVIYLWRGERHVHSRTCNTHSEALVLAAAMRRDRWQAWVECR